MCTYVLRWSCINMLDNKWHICDCTPLHVRMFMAIRSCILVGWLHTICKFTFNRRSVFDRCCNASFHSSASMHVCNVHQCMQCAIRCRSIDLVKCMTCMHTRSCTCTVFIHRQASQVSAPKLHQSA